MRNGKGLGVLIAAVPKGSDTGRGGPPDDPDEMPAHEAAETPAQESSEDYGAKLMTDIESVGQAHGLDANQSHAIAADLFSAVAKCLGGGGEEAPAPVADKKPPSRGMSAPAPGGYSA